MKVLVTGANGFLGSAVVRALAEKGHQVRCLHRKYSDLSLLAHTNFESVLGDIEDPASLENACHGQEVIYHLAGVIGYQSSMRALMEKVNVGGTKNIIAAALQCKVQRFIYLSSVVAIGAGVHPSEILNEDSEYNLSSYNLGYFETKKAAEKIVTQAVREHRLDAVILNPSTIYGFGDAQKGSRKNQIKVAQGLLKYFPPGGVSVVGLEDVVQAILTATEKGRAGERYILSGENILLRDLFQMIAEEAGSTPPYLKIPAGVLKFLGAVGYLQEELGLKPFIPQETAVSACLYHWFRHDKAKKELSFNPAPARTAIKSSVAWMKKQGIC